MGRRDILIPAGKHVRQSPELCPQDLQFLLHFVNLLLLRDQGLIQLLNGLVLKGQPYLHVAQSFFHNIPPYQCKTVMRVKNKDKGKWQKVKGEK